MEIQLQRVFETATFTHGVLQVWDGFTCATGEDAGRVVKLPDHTRVPAGRYPINLRTNSPMASAYRDRFGKRHHGMLWVRHVPGFKWIYLHVGNTHHDTRGCPLVGTAANYGKGTVERSVQAYKAFFPRVVEPIMDGEDVFLNITERLAA